MRALTSYPGAQGGGGGETSSGGKAAPVSECPFSQEKMAAAAVGYDRVYGSVDHVVRVLVWRGKCTRGMRACNNGSGLLGLGGMGCLRGGRDAEKL